MKSCKDISRWMALGAAGLASIFSVAAQDEPFVRFSLRVLDETGKEVRWVIPGTNRTSYKLEAYAENMQAMEKPVVALAWTIRKPEEVFMTENLQPNPHYGVEDYFYPYEMDPRGNAVENTSSSNVRQTLTRNLDGTPKVPEGRVNGGGVFARHSLYVPEKFTDIFTGRIYVHTNFVTRTFLYEKAVALEIGGIKKPAQNRSLRIAIMPRDYAGTMLVADVNDGEVPPTDAVVKKLDEFVTRKDIRRFGYEPFYAVGPKASGNFLLQRSINDVSGPWTTVQTITPGTAGSFNDREAYTNNWNQVFYRIVPETAAQANKPSTQSWTSSQALENKVK